jgi:hypothetical protein
MILILIHSLHPRHLFFLRGLALSSCNRGNNWWIDFLTIGVLVK